MDGVTFRPAAAADWEAVSALLTEANLPLAGAREHLETFILAWRGDDLLGCAGMERYGADGLLRSVAVRATARGLGLGQALTGRVLDAARADGLRRVTLLTETAPDFFPRLGFHPAEAPAAVRGSVEFTGACPDSAVSMLLEL